MKQGQFKKYEKIVRASILEEYVNLPTFINCIAEI
jgi:hypothetical protein